ncbi:hypothetical protein ABOM_002276 [Aspergillus bombycis]|uniref:Amidohydrolase-related domain-containing protein n=1 Tax=Aspergillus bombycis TaxID=109264 RepID=A0A1F8ABU0_9EURO|nr:hypothetical protein ABOM_002276 [Aspergillus bombycis]OGM49153.1 hypothetical protein ABOM_002276 [Aspergillus bombycis]
MSSHMKRSPTPSPFAGTSILRDAGITMCYGSDLLADLYTLQNREFSIQSAVLSPLEILQSAAINAAKLVDITVLDRVQKSLVAIAKDGRIVTRRGT